MPPPQRFGRWGPKATPATALKTDRCSDHRCSEKGEHQTNARREILQGPNYGKETEYSASSKKIMCKIQSKNPAIAVQEKYEKMNGV